MQALVDAGTINDKLARQVIEGVLAGEGSPAEVVAARGLAVVSDDGALGEAVDAAIAANPDVADKIRAGKVQAAGALIGAVMKADARSGRRGQGARADLVQAVLTAALSRAGSAERPGRVRDRRRGHPHLVGARPPPRSATSCDRG